MSEIEKINPLDESARINWHRAAESDTEVSVPQPSSDMNMGQLEDYMSHPLLAVRIAAIRQALYKGKLEGLEIWGKSLRGES